MIYNTIRRMSMFDHDGSRYKRTLYKSHGEIVV